MKTLTTFFLLSALILCGTTIKAQQAQTVPGQLLVQVYEGTVLGAIVEDLMVVDGTPTQINVVREISDHMRIWLFEFDETAVDSRKMLNAMYQHPSVSIAQFNHVTSNRVVPNDSQYSSQWQYDNDGSGGGAVADADIDAPEAWDITTGGTTTQGDEIVVCVVDEGYNPSHPDFGDNVYVNGDEIPGNGIDDDGNGYIDDINGWDAYNNDGNIAIGGGHGNPVSGIIGAQGNNSLGVSGVNWDVKVMMVRGSSGSEATVLAAYNYPLTQRKRYNDSNGNTGAFVVSTNASFGVDFGQPADAPLWCAMYDSLGKYGITSCGATINGNQNVDVIGDLPTACPSPHLISVTNMGWDDNKVTSAGYGATTIDIGSFGQGAHNITTSGYGGFGGTSGATPHIAGAIALAYSAPCNDFITLAKTDPQAASLAVIQYIYDGADPNASLAGITTTGKRQNLRGMLDELLLNCGVAPACNPPSSLSATVTSATSVNLSWSPSATATLYQVQGRIVGMTSWRSSPPTSSTSYTVGILEEATDYEWRVRALCGDGTPTGFSAIGTFSTPSCLVYCASSAGNASEEWIESVDIDGNSFVSNSNGGYVSFGTAHPFSLSQGTTHSFTVTPGYSGTMYNEWYRIWVDYNGDGDFDDAGEMVYDSPSAVNTPVSGSFTVPAGAISGKTGMRVSMAYSSAPDACGTWTWGEVEDYCVEISGSARMASLAPQMDVWSNPATELLTVNIGGVQEGAVVELVDLQGKVLSSHSVDGSSNSLQLDVSTLPASMYLVRLSDGNFTSTKLVAVQ